MRRKLIIAFSVLAIGVLWRFGPVVKARFSATESPAVIKADVQNQQLGRVQMIKFLLFEEGIYPRNMTIHDGLINLTVEDKTHRSQGLAVERINENAMASVGRVETVGEYGRGRELLRFVPGTYRVSDMSNPQNNSILVVEP